MKSLFCATRNEVRIVTILIVVLQLLILSQSQAPVDSLKESLNTNTGKDKLEILSELGSIYNNIDMDSSIIFSEQGLKLARELELPQYEADFLRSLAFTYYLRVDFEPALENLFASLKIYEAIQDTVGQINSIYGISSIYSNRMQYDLSLNYAEIGLRISKESSNKSKIAIFSELLGDIYIELEGDYGKAIKYYDDSYEYFRSINDEWSLSVTATNMGKMYTKLGEYSKAERYLNESYEIAKKIGDKNRIAGVLLALGENYFAVGDYNKARKTLTECIAKTKKAHQRYGLISREILAKVDSAEGKYLSAYKNRLKYFDLYDSLISENSQKELSELESKYQNEKKQARIELLEKDNQIQTLWRNSFIGAFIFAFILAGGLYNRYRYKNKTSKELTKLNNQLEGELKQAAEYIESLLPLKLDEKVKTDWKFIPSAHLGGDSFGYSFLDENHFALYLIDVSGHGVGAALLSTSVLNILKSKSLPNTDFYNPAEVLNNLNRSFNMEEHGDKYFALWYGVLDLKTYELVCASAFHPPAIGITNGQSIKYGKKEMMIGAFEDYNYENAFYQLSKGESIFLFSDGCFEIESEISNFEFDDFVSVIKSAKDTSEQPLDDVYSSLISLKKSENFEDDFSMINIKLQ